MPSKDFPWWLRCECKLNRIESINRKKGKERNRSRKKKTAAAKLQISYFQCCSFPNLSSTFHHFVSSVTSHTWPNSVMRANIIRKKKLCNCHRSCCVFFSVRLLHFNICRAFVMCWFTETVHVSQLMEISFYVCLFVVCWLNVQRTIFMSQCVVIKYLKFDLQHQRLFDR